MSADRPSAAWIARFVKAAALNKVASTGASIHVQQRMYNAWMKMLNEGERKWPHIDFMRGLDGAVSKWLNDNPLRGPGKDW